MKKYKVGFFGGKFMPFHKGHFHCLQKAVEECEVVYLIMFVGGLQENEIITEHNEEYLKVESRVAQMRRAVMKLRNEGLIRPVVIDVSKCVLSDGSEDWDAETPLVRDVCGPQIDAVYGSEPSYAAYFAKAYPEAEYRMVDVDRSTVNISGTKCRAMNEKERQTWMV